MSSNSAVQTNNSGEVLSAAPRAEVIQIVNQHAERIDNTAVQYIRARLEKKGEAMFSEDKFKDFFLRIVPGVLLGGFIKTYKTWQFCKDSWTVAEASHVGVRKAIVILMMPLVFAWHVLTSVVFPFGMLLDWTSSSNAAERPYVSGGLKKESLVDMLRAAHDMAYVDVIRNVREKSGIGSDVALSEKEKRYILCALDCRRQDVAEKFKQLHYITGDERRELGEFGQRRLSDEVIKQMLQNKDDLNAAVGRLCNFTWELQSNPHRLEWSAKLSPCLYQGTNIKPKIIS